MNEALLARFDQHLAEKLLVVAFVVFLISLVKFVEAKRPEILCDFPRVAFTLSQELVQNVLPLRNPEESS